MSLASHNGLLRLLFCKIFVEEVLLVSSPSHHQKILSAQNGAVRGGLLHCSESLWSFACRAACPWLRYCRSQTPVHPSLGKLAESLLRLERVGSGVCLKIYTYVKGRVGERAAIRLFTPQLTTAKLRSQKPWVSLLGDWRICCCFPRCIKEELGCK